MGNGHYGQCLKIYDQQQHMNEHVLWKNLESFSACSQSSTVSPPAGVLGVLLYQLIVRGT